MKRRVLCMAGVLMTGCATTPYRPGSAAGYQGVLTSWTGRNRQVLLQAWGAPTAVQSLPNGGSKFTWATMPFGPRLVPPLDCATSAIIDSSGTIASWVSKGPDCHLPYSVDELQKKHEAVRNICSTLQKNQRIRLTFYDGAENRSTGRKFGKTYVGYFSRCSTTYDTVAISDSPPGLLQGYPTEYPLSLLEDITLLEPPAKAQSENAVRSPVEKVPEIIRVNCSSPGGTHLELRTGQTAAPFVIQSDHGLV